MEKKIKDLQLRELFTRHKENCAIISQMADTAEKENRELTAKENDRYHFLLRENQIIGMRIYTESAKQLRENKSDFSKADEIIQRSARECESVEIMVFRDLIAIEDARNGGLVAVNIQDIVNPLQDRVIFDKVGIPFQTGVQGDLAHLYYDSVSMYLNHQEIESIPDQKIKIKNDLSITPEVMSCFVTTSFVEMRKNEAQSVNQSMFENIVKLALSNAAGQLINRVVMGTTKANSTTKLKGPFVDLEASAQTKEFTTLKDYVDMKTAILKTGVQGDTLCWVMNPLRKAVAETTPKVAGGSVMICENDMIAGLPVFTTNCIGGEYVGLGDWKYQPTALCGPITLTTNPFTQSHQNNMIIQFRTELITKTLFKEAFALCKVSDVMTQQIMSDRQAAAALAAQEEEKNLKAAQETLLG